MAQVVKHSHCYTICMDTNLSTDAHLIDTYDKYYQEIFIKLLYLQYYNNWNQVNIFIQIFIFIYLIYEDNGTTYIII